MASKLIECKECGVVFNSSESLSVHVTYGHGKKWENEEANNNTTKKFAPDSSTDVKKSPGEAFQHPPTPQSFSSSPYQHEQQYQQHADLGYLKQEPHSPMYQQQPYFEQQWEQQQQPQQQQQQYHYAPPQRFHPYQYERPQVSSSFPPQPTPSPSPKQCDKCGFQCELQSQLAEHVTLSHPQQYFFMDQPPTVIKEEDVQSEILDLDSHKVHSVYQEEPSEKQRNGDNPHSVNALLWNNPKYQQHQQQMFQTVVPPPPTGNGHPNGLDFIQAGGGGGGPNEYPRTTPQYEASSSQVPTNPPQTPPTNTKSTNWKSNEARRPKTYNCTACNKWFTSSGHLKRHYNTTLHKNAVKSSGQPDPATMPISAHHHPAREPSNKDEQHSVSPDEDTNSMPLVQQQQQQQQQQQPTVLVANPPNGDAGLSLDHSRGLLPSYTMDHHHHPQFQMYPNELAPHVTQVTINNLNISGSNYGTNEELSDVLLQEFQPAEQDQQLPLPSFAQLHRQANVGGGGPVTAPFTYIQNDYIVMAAQAPSFEEHHHHHHHQETTTQVPEDEMILPCSPPIVVEYNHNNNIINPLMLLPAKNQQQQQQQQQPQEQTPEKAHIKRDFEEIAAPSSPIVSSTTVTSPHSCATCNKTFNKACYLTQHNRTFHCGEKPFKCPRCGKRFSNSIVFEEHAKKHAGEKPHKCDQCPKQFNHKTDLRRHMCLHSGHKPFKCDSCGKGFIRKDHMQKHCETHTRKLQVKQQQQQQQQQLVAAGQV